ncbi:MAG: hypothetical protein K1X74_18630 [Pirellulales bacterium]|nr:hypothetical protein [Pirellulales bacterium]
MEINRNQYFLVGIVLLLLGIQFRMVDTYVLNEQASRVLAKAKGSSSSSISERTVSFLPSLGPVAPRKSITPPEWLGWCIGSIGAVLILHSLAMPKPAG